LTHLRSQKAYLYYRHTLPVRVMHWINVIALTILFMSGLNIFQRVSGAALGQIILFGRGRRFSSWKRNRRAAGN
jgi:cytochrome b subunit of formate dehydrogenase